MSMGEYSLSILPMLQCGTAFHRTVVSDGGVHTSCPLATYSADLHCWRKSGLLTRQSYQAPLCR